MRTKLDDCKNPGDLHDQVCQLIDSLGVGNFQIIQTDENQISKWYQTVSGCLHFSSQTHHGVFDWGENTLTITRNP